MGKSKSSIFIKLFTTSMTVLLFFITLMSFVVYFYSARAVHKSIGDLNIQILSQLKDVTDNKILIKCDEFIIKNFSGTGINERMIEIFGIKNPGQKFLYDYYQTLKTLWTSTDFINNIHIYIPGESLLISTQGIRFLGDDRTLIDFEKNIMQLFQNQERVTPWIHTYVDSNGVNIFSRIMAYPLAATPETIQGYIAVDIKEELIYNSISAASPGENQNIFVIDEKGNVISHSDKSYLYENLMHEDYISRVLNSRVALDYFYTKIKDVESVVSFAKSAYNNWYYVSVVDAKELFAVNSIIKWFIILIYISVIILGSIVVYLLSKRFYSPIKSLLSIAGSITGYGSSDEYDIIKHTMGSLSSQVSSYKSIIEDSLPVLKNNFINQLLFEHNLTAAEIAETMNMLDIRFLGEDFLALQFVFGYADNCTIESKKLFEYAFVGFLEDYRSENIAFLCSDMGGNRLSVLASFKQTTFAEIIEILKFFTEHLGKAEGISFNVLVGEPVKSLSEVHVSFKKALLCEKYLFVCGQNQIITYENIIKRERSAETIDEETLFNSLKNVINSNDAEKIGAVFYELLNLLEHGCYSYNYVQSLLMKMMSVITEIIRVSGLNSSEILSNKSKIYDEFQCCNNICETLDFIQNLCMEVSLHLSKNVRNNLLIKKIMDYINKNLDGEISLSSIADVLFLNRTYVSRIFKEETGMNFIDYVSEKKIEKAAEILTKEDVKVKDLCTKLGYSNPNYFISKFKAKYGITPKQYQNINRKEKL